MVAIGVATGLVVGKPVGVVLACAAAVRLRIATLPDGLTWGGLIVVGVVAGIGFTMAMFIAELAFQGDAARLSLAKLAILVASVLAAAVSLVLGRALLSRTAADGTAPAAERDVVE
jgi:NhaA family Na+:H+ antiporter